MSFLRNWFSSLGDIYSLKPGKTRDRLIALTSSLLASFYNVFITGIFYTGFLSMYGISISELGILTFVPYIANLLSIFSPKFLSHFKRRKALFLVTKVIYYAVYILASTIMPQFVEGSAERLRWFVIIVAAATGFNAFFAQGFNIWFYQFFPAENDRRTRYLTLNQTFSSVLSSLILMLSSFITDALTSSANQDQLILFFRYFAFALVLVEVLIQSFATEYPYQETENIELKKVFTLPFHYKKFMRCTIVMFIWNYIANLNNGLWQYHLLNHMEFSYTLINAMSSVAYTFMLVLAAPIWKKWIRYHSWIKTFAIAMILYVPTEFMFFAMTSASKFMFAPTSIIQHFMNVGVNLSYANIVYMNLPEENSTTHLTFNTVGCNIFAFLGLMTGTWVSSLYEGTILFLGMEIYAVQWTTIMRGVLLGTVGTYLFVKWKDFTKDADIEEVEYLKSFRTKQKGL